MSRGALRIGTPLLLATLAGPVLTGAVDVHLNPSVVEGGCRACHEGHGTSRSPMLPAPQSEVCLSCHASRARADAMVSRGLLSAAARPQFLETTLSLPFVHPLSEEAVSSHQASVVTCTSCHSPHRDMADQRSLGVGAAGGRRLSPRNPNEWEFELCQGCHGSEGVQTQSLFDLSRLTNPNNASYHPVEGPAAVSSPSLDAAQSGQEISCSDCHGNSDPLGARGPHGSAVRYLLRANYTTVDGSAESANAYRLCYQCHDRRRVLEGSPFPQHAMHVIDEQASCATCHSAHGSVENRGLIRFGEETSVGGVAPSVGAGRLAFESSGPGSGACYLTCHGVDHAPAVYGGEMVATPGLLDAMDVEARPRARPEMPQAGRPHARQPVRPPNGR